MRGALLYGCTRRVHRLYAYDGGAPNPYYNNRLHSVIVHTYMACTLIMLCVNLAGWATADIVEKSWFISLNFVIA